MAVWTLGYRASCFKARILQRHSPYPIATLRPIVIDRLGRQALPLMIGQRGMAEACAVQYCPAQIALRHYRARKVRVAHACATKVAKVGAPLESWEWGSGQSALCRPLQTARQRLVKCQLCP